MKVLTSLFAALLIVFFCAPARAGDPQAAFAYALAIANAKPESTIDPEVMRAIQTLSDKIDALDKKIDAKAVKAPAGNATNPLCTCPNCGCGLNCTCDGTTCSCALCSPKAAANTTAPGQQVCSIVGYDSYGRAITSCTGATLARAGALQTTTYSSPVYSYSTPYYSGAVYATYSSPTHTHWSDGTVSYSSDVSYGRGGRCGPIRRLLGLCQ